MKRIFFVAGERSGDTHGASLIRALRALDPSLQCEGLGGQLMAEAGMALRQDLAGQAIMGFAEVIKRLLPLRRLLLDTIEYLRAARPDAVVLIDYPGMNIRIAKAAHALGIPVVYYISPQVWAWKKNRIHTLARVVNKMLVILPFEEALFRNVGMDCTYVGHPLLDHLETRPASNETSEDLVIGLLPGSREQEIARLMHPMLAVAEGIRACYPHARFIAPCVNEERAQQVRAVIKDFPMEVRVDVMHDVLAKARFCLVASGTATLETALFNVPMIITYKVGMLNYWLARWFIRGITHIGIVNILMGRGIVPEFLQQDAVPEKMLPKALELIGDTPARRTMLDDFAELRHLLGDTGASDRAAREILALLKGDKHG
ncbi:MAG TPA: lipid-A-disaccharide synthase [Candidatus Hydrogenedentes bacterium]|nr:lipid-A-disaccharide synthase [Candidatus Hydrogenedentota bacterium]